MLYASLAAALSFVAAAAAAEAHCMASYVWQQDYWTGKDSSYDDFYKALRKDHKYDDYDCGDLYVNVADASNQGHLANPKGLAKFMEDYYKHNSKGRVYLFYAGGAKGYDDKKWAPEYVKTYTEFVYKYGPKYHWGPIGISFVDVELDEHAWKDIFHHTDEMKHYLYKHYKYDVYVDVHFYYNYHYKHLVELYMKRADHVSVATYSNTYEGLIKLYKYFFKYTFPHAYGKDYYKYKAKITFVGEGNCESKHSCGKTSFCAYYSDKYDDPKGGIRYAYDVFEKADTYVRRHILSRKQYEHYFEGYGSKYGLNYFYWVQCYYGKDLWYKAGLKHCRKYRYYSDQCRRHY
ncbi:hypothetical protein FOZ61_003905 [Perkinsus olseni]|uniref:Uncharacterized protein n=1 Tax=Perkinsus olseni TaxID=32597 RepID=A0A7J6LMW0_PEROL|nr:hypothetical protein FOZ61_003905 [Perkinsus olseni]